MRPIIKKKFTAFDAACIAGILVAAIVTHSITCRTISRRIIHLVLRTREVSAQVADLDMIRATVESGEQHIEMFTSQLATLHRRIPDDLNTDRFLKELVETAERHNVLILRVNPGEVSGQGSYRDVPVVVDAQAVYKDVYSLIKAVREMPRLVTVEEIRVRSSEDALAQVTFILRIYAYKEIDDERLA